MGTSTRNPLQLHSPPPETAAERGSNPPERDEPPSPPQFAHRQASGSNPARSTDWTVYRAQDASSSNSETGLPAEEDLNSRVVVETAIKEEWGKLSENEKERYRQERAHNPNGFVDRQGDGVERSATFEETGERDGEGKNGGKAPERDEAA
ncbi:hypothetical protein JCM16303_005383 [Sporobolomyces ruberrimus]